MRLTFFILIALVLLSLSIGDNTGDSNNAKKYRIAVKKAVELLNKKDSKGREDAVRFLKKATELVPEEPKAWCVWGKYLQNSRDLEHCISLLKQCATLENTASNQLNYGISLFDWGYAQKAIPVFERVLRMDPANTKALHYYGLALAWTSRCDEAKANLVKVLDTEIFSNNYFNILYVCYNAIHDTKNAELMDGKRDRTMPNKEGTAFNQAVMQLNSGDYTASLRNLQIVLGGFPNMSEAFFIMGKVYQKMDDIKKAVIALEKSRQLIKRGNVIEAKITEVFVTLYDVYVGLTPPNHNGGLSVMEDITTLYPSDLQQLFGFYHIKQYISSLQGLTTLKRRSIDELIKQQEYYTQESEKGEIPPLTPLRASVMVPPDIQTIVNNMYGVYSRSHNKYFSFKHDPVNQRRVRSVLRVGLLTGDLYYNHPMMHLMRTGLRMIHDCEAILLAPGTKSTGNATKIYTELGLREEDEITIRSYKKGKDVFNLKKTVVNRPGLRILNLYGESEEEKANIIHSLDLDVLIDLTGYTHNGETHVIGKRPAVVQANYLGFPAQMTLPWYDFNIQDSAASPPQFASFYPDKLVYLPYYYMCNHHQKVPDLHPYQRPSANRYLRRNFKVPEEGTLYCFPNQLYKLTPDLLDSWANILREHATSYLWLLRHPSEGEQHIKEEFMGRGIHVDRILFSDFEEDKALYMVRTSICDVILDSTLWSAGATGLDAYWSGVPIINIPGDRTVERLGLSLMASFIPRATYYNKTDLDQRFDAGKDSNPPLITVSMKDYEDTTIRTQKDKHLQAGIRMELVKKVSGDDFVLTKTPVVRHPHQGGQFDAQYWIDSWVMSFYAMYDVMYIAGESWVVFSVSVDI